MKKEIATFGPWKPFRSYGYSSIGKPRRIAKQFTVGVRAIDDRDKIHSIARSVSISLVFPFVRVLWDSRKNNWYLDEHNNCEDCNKPLLDNSSVCDTCWRAQCEGIDIDPDNFRE